MHFSTPFTALMVLLAPSLVVAELPGSGSGWGSNDAWATQTDSVTTTYIAQTTVTMTLLQVQTETMHYWSAKNTTTASSTDKVPSPSAKTPVDVSATPSTCENCEVSTGGAALQGANLVVAAIAGVGALVWGSL